MRCERARKYCLSTSATVTMDEVLITCDGLAETTESVSIQAMPELPFTRNKNIRWLNKRGGQKESLPNGDSAKDSCFRFGVRVYGLEEKGVSEECEEEGSSKPHRHLRRRNCLFFPSKHILHQISWWHANKPAEHSPTGRQNILTLVLWLNR